MSFLQHMTTREKKIWAELIVDAVVVCFYFPQIIQVMLAGGAGVEAFGLTVKTIFLAITLAIISEIIIYFICEPETKDERDSLFLMKGSVVALWCLVACIFLIIGQTYFSLVFPDHALLFGIEYSPMLMAHLLLGAVIISFSIKSVVQIFLYRRGY